MEGNVREDPSAKATMTGLNRFLDGFDRHNLEAVMDTITEDCVWDSTGAPDGERHDGREAIRNAFQAFFQASPQASFDTEELFECGDRAVVRWLYRWMDAEGKTGHVRGVDVLKTRDGKVAEKLSYVKG